MNTYRKTNTGKWAVMGLASVIAPGATVIVTKKDGTTAHEKILSVGKTFDVQGQPHVYGYPAPKNESVHTDYSKPSSGREMCAECGERPGVKLCRDSSGLSDMCCSRCASYSAYERSFA